VDERRLRELFAEAAEQAGRDAPPPGFDHDAVLSGSRRATARARRRQNVLAAAAVVVVVLGGGATAVGLSGRSGHPSTLAEPSATPPGPRVFAQETPAAPGTPAPGAQAAPGFGPRARVASPEAAPGGRASELGKRRAGGSCARADQQLFSRLATAVPRVGSARPLDDAAPCPEGARGVQVDVTDHGVPGTLRVRLDPPGAAAPRPGSGGLPVRVATARTPDGRDLTVWATAAAPGPVPLAGRLDALARTLAAGD
jgi:hypothetical protein